MRAKEYLALRKKELYYYDIVEKTIRELHSLRFDKAATEEYFNRYLFADARSRVDKNFVLQEGEVDPTVALAVRIEICHVIAGDDSFVYAYNIIVQGKNKFCHSVAMRLYDLKEENIPTLQEMRELYYNCKEDLQHVVEGILRCLLDQSDFHLSNVPLDRIDLLWEFIREFYMTFCRTSKYRKEMEELKTALTRKEQEIATLEESLLTLRNQLSAYGKGGMTVAETALTFYYLFDELGVDFSNSDKTQWARFIHRLTGKSYQRVREALYFDFDQKSTRKNLRNVASLFAELFPRIETKIKNDMEPLR